MIGKVDANDIPGENEIIVMWQKEHCDKVGSTFIFFLSLFMNLID